MILILNKVIMIIVLNKLIMRLILNNFENDNHSHVVVHKYYLY